MPQRVSSSENGQILLGDCIRQRAENLRRRDSRFDQIDNVRFGKDATLGGHLVQLGDIEVNGRCCVGCQANLDQALVDCSASAARTFVVHGTDR